MEPYTEYFQPMKHLQGMKMWFLVQTMVKENRAGKIPITLAKLDNKIVRVQKGERLGSISPVKIRK